MCLYYNKGSKDEGWRVADEDIVCYKVLLVKKGVDTKGETIEFRYVTPFQDMPVKLGETYENEEEVNEYSSSSMVVSVSGATRQVISVSANHSSDVMQMSSEGSNFRVEGGVFHSYAHFLDAKWAATRVAEVMGWNPMVAIGKALGWNPTVAIGFMVVACIIPKGTKYVSGRDFNGAVSFASKTFKITDDVLFIYNLSAGALEKLKERYPEAEYFR